MLAFWLLYVFLIQIRNAEAPGYPLGVQGLHMPVLQKIVFTPIIFEGSSEPSHWRKTLCVPSAGVYHLFQIVK
jgi:hypothetical protein